MTCSPKRPPRRRAVMSNTAANRRQRRRRRRTCPWPSRTAWLLTSWATGQAASLSAAFTRGRRQRRASSSSMAAPPGRPGAPGNAPPPSCPFSIGLSLPRPIAVRAPSCRQPAPRCRHGRLLRLWAAVGAAKPPKSALPGARGVEPTLLGATPARRAPPASWPPSSPTSTAASGVPLRARPRIASSPPCATASWRRGVAAVAVTAYEKRLPAAAPRRAAPPLLRRRAHRLGHLRPARQHRAPFPAALFGGDWAAPARRSCFAASLGPVTTAVAAPPGRRAARRGLELPEPRRAQAAAVVAAVVAPAGAGAGKPAGGAAPGAAARSSTSP